jgi:hypothetical protein
MQKFSLLHLPLTVSHWHLDQTTASYVSGTQKTVLLQVSAISIALFIVLCFHPMVRHCLPRWGTLRYEFGMLQVVAFAFYKVTPIA